MPRQTVLRTDLKLGEKYRDRITGLEGTVTSIAFFLSGCERASLEFLKDGEIKYESFDADRLEHLSTRKVAQTARTGGPQSSTPTRTPAPRR